MSQNNQIIVVISRESNIELMRIIAMLFIVLHHFCAFSGFPDMLDSSSDLSHSTIFATMVNSFLFISVNCFILISGYHGVSLKAKSVLKLYLTCFCYGLLGYLIHLATSDDTIGMTLIYNSVFCFSHSQWWYISCYIGLLLVSPIINLALKHFTKKQHQVAILCLTILSVYLGNFWNNAGEMYDFNGFSLLHFIYIYIIGDYLKKYVTISSCKSKRKWFFAGWVVLSLLFGVLTCWQHPYNPYIHWQPWTYNNLVIIISAICFFLFFISFEFKSRAVNWLAGGVLAAYLIQDQPLVGSVLYPFVGDYFAPMHYLPKMGCLVVLSILFLLCAILIDKVLQGIIKPIKRRNE